MRLIEDPEAIIYDTADSAVASLSAAALLRGVDTRERLREALIDACNGDPSIAPRITNFMTVMRRIASGRNEIAPFPVLMVFGLDMPKTDYEKNLFMFLTRVHGTNTTDLRTGKPATGLINGVKDVRRFTPELHPLAADLLRIIADDITVETAETVDPLQILASGLFAPLIDVVLEEGEGGLEDFPDEILLELFRPSILARMPRGVELFRKYVANVREKMETEKERLAV